MKRIRIKLSEDHVAFLCIAIIIGAGLIGAVLLSLPVPP